MSWIMQNKAEEKNVAFSKGTPTAFIIESPFQLLCSWEAIEEFEIKDYKIILVLDKDNIRNKQTFSMLNDRDMDYDVYYWTEASFNNIQSQDMRYDRIMIGDYDDLSLMRVAESYASNHAEIVFMDDGVSSIMILQNLPYHHSPLVAKLRKILKGPIGLERARQEIFEHWDKIGIKNDFCMFTIYESIVSKKFKIYPNKLSHLFKKQEKKQNVVLIVGTTIFEMAEKYNISVALFEGLLWAKLVKVKELYPDEKIIYIPHGRDKDPRIQLLCQCLEIDFMRIDMSIEYFVLKNNLNVIAVYGTLSTALYTLKKLTGAPVVHWMIYHRSNKHKYLHDQYARFYKKTGVKTEYIYVPEEIQC